MLAASTRPGDVRQAARILGLLALVLSAQAAGPEFSQDIARWWTAPAPPPESERKAHKTWFFAANYSDIEWHVAADHGRVLADRAESRLPQRRPKADFSPKAGRFVGASAFARVDDGWLVGFNHGEFGAALFWFSADGQQNYRISDHQVVDFFELPDGIHAIEGLAHLGMSAGSVIRISRTAAGAQWRADTLARLPFAPYAVSVRKDGSLLITLSDSLVSVGKDRQVVTVHPQPLWSGLYPTSSVLSADEGRLYIGMRQYVVEIDLATKAARYLVPSKEFINTDTSPMQ